MASQKNLLWAKNIAARKPLKIPSTDFNGKNFMLSRCFQESCYVLLVLDKSAIISNFCNHAGMTDEASSVLHPWSSAVLSTLVRMAFERGCAKIFWVGGISD
jgi:hypothetical protein